MGFMVGETARNIRICRLSAGMLPIIARMVMEVLRIVQVLVIWVWGGGMMGVQSEGLHQTVKWVMMMWLLGAIVSVAHGCLPANLGCH